MSSYWGNSLQFQEHAQSKGKWQMPEASEIISSIGFITVLGSSERAQGCPPSPLQRYTKYTNLFILYLCCNIIPVSLFCILEFHTICSLEQKTPLISNTWKPQILYHFSDIGKQSPWEADWYPQSYIPIHRISRAAVLQMWSRINRSIIPWELLRNENSLTDPRSTEPATTRGCWAICVLTSPPRYIDTLKFENPGAVPIFFHYSLSLLILVQHPNRSKHSATAPETLNLTGESPTEKVKMPWESIYSLLVTFTFHFHALEKEMATHSSVLAWRIPGTGEPGGLPSMGSQRVRHDWSDLAAAAAAV